MRTVDWYKPTCYGLTLDLIRDRGRYRRYVFCELVSIFMHSDCVSPVLFLFYKREKCTLRVLEAIRDVKPRRLYLASDGPRNEEESSRVLALRHEVQSRVDWDCELMTLFRDENLGCREAVAGAISWFFEHEEAGIILEEDCLPSPSFFSYTEKLLDKYQADKRIMSISGVHHQGEWHRPNSDYFYTVYHSCWGWATWRRAWKHYDPSPSVWVEAKGERLIESLSNDVFFRRGWRKKFEATYANQNNSWAYRWLLCCWSQSGLSIMPSRNLIKNIGFDAEATHCQGDRVPRFCRNDSLEFLITTDRPPLSVIPDKKADRWTTKHVHRLSFLGYVISRAFSFLRWIKLL